MRSFKWISLMLAICLLSSLFTTAISEDQALEPGIDAEVLPAQSVDESTGLMVDTGEVAEPAEEPQSWEENGNEDSEAVEAGSVAAPQSAMRYATVLTQGAPVYIRSSDWDMTAVLGAYGTVLVTGYAGDRAAVAFNVGGILLEGFMDPADIALLDDAQTAACLDAMAYGEVMLYAGDLNWPLPPLPDAVWGEALAVMANYSDYSNDTVYTMNGVQISANMVPDPGPGRCWTYAQGIYKLVWGCKFSEDFKGNASTGLNLLRELNDAQRRLTPAHLKAFILKTEPGATIRICGCTTSCGSFNNDGLSCGHPGHSLIVVDHNDQGLVTMDSNSNSQHTRFYTWNGFCNAWSSSSYPCHYVKYIKWPNAPAISADSISEDGSAEIPVSGVALDQTELTVDMGSSVTLTAMVSPADATQQGVNWVSSDTSVATVSNGVVTGVRVGTATVGVQTVDGGKTAYCTVTVREPVTRKALTKKGSNGTVTLAIGEKLQLSADFATAKGWKLKSVKSSKKKYATVDAAGLVTALSPGKTKITVTTTNKKKATLTVKVVDPSKPTKVALNKKGTVKLKVGETLKLESAVLPTTAVTTLRWKSSNKKVAVVDADGNVTALKKGKCTIAVKTANGKYAKVKIKVSK